EFDPNMDTFNYRREINIDGHSITLDIFDQGTPTYNHHRFTLPQGFIFIYDCTRIDTLYRLITLRSQLLQLLGSVDVAAIVVENKIDREREREVSSEQGRKLAIRMGCLFISASAKTGVNVQETFEAISRLMTLKHLQKRPPS